MTKYILHGGVDPVNIKTSNCRDFFVEATKNLSETSTILCVYFAEKKESWLDFFEQDKINIQAAASASTFNFILASDDVGIFVEQIKKADVIYLHGGSTEKLQNQLSLVPNLSELWDGSKIVAGSSAGVHVLSKYYFSKKRNGLYAGLGILPIKTFCHYSEEMSDKLELLKKYGEEMEVCAIPEEQFVTIEQ